MRVSVDGKSVEISGKKVMDALSELNINPETVLVKRKGELITEEDELRDGDVLETISVISGG